MADLKRTRNETDSSLENKKKKEEPQGDPEDASDDEDVIGPMPLSDGQQEEETKSRKRRVLKHEKLFLGRLPSAMQYEHSFMHRDTISHIVVTKTDFIVTASSDGHVKFWKKMETGGIEFVKHFRAHLGLIESLSVSSDGFYLASTSNDQAVKATGSTVGSLKLYDVLNFDMLNMLVLKYAVGSTCWVHVPDAPIPLIACADKSNGDVWLYTTRPGNEPLAQVSVHKHPITCIQYNPVYDVVVSCDERGFVEYWEPTSYGLPSNVAFEYKSDTDLFEFVKLKTAVYSLNFSPDGKHFVLCALDRKVRVFDFLKGKMIRAYDESLEASDKQQQASNLLQPMDYGRRVAGERELEKSSAFRFQNAVFDESGFFILFSSMFGIKVINIVSNRCVAIIGKGESIRFVHVALYQAVPKKRGGAALTIEMAASDNPNLNENMFDPTLFCTAYKKNRFYLLTRREPNDVGGDVGRDIFNEKPTREEQIAATSAIANQKLAEQVVLYTTVGDIHIRLFPTECPKTVENFVTHCRNGYFNGLLFHRVIKGFMVQTGDPFGDGTGGESIWKKEFEDEFHPSLRHDRPFTVSMANAGPNTNGSQFFITVAPAAWLDNKHTVFGRVFKGMEVVQEISNYKTNPKDDRPYEDIKIINAVVK